MIIAGLFQVIPIIIGGYNSPHDGYPYGAKVSYTQQLQSVILNAEDHNTSQKLTYYTLAELKMTADVGFDFEGEGFYITNFVFEAKVSLYDYRSSDATYKGGYTFSYSPSWSYTQNTSFVEFEECFFTMDLDGPNHEFYSYFVLHDTAVASSYMAFNDDSSDYSYGYWNFDSSKLVSVLDQYVTSGGLSWADAEQIADTNFNEGYSKGYQDAITQGEPSVIFNGILDVALLPVNVFLTILNFDVFGVNIGGLVTGILTLGLVIIIVRIIFSGGNKS